MLPDHRERFNGFLLSSTQKPPSSLSPLLTPPGSLFDFIFDAKSKMWLRWMEFIPPLSLPSPPISSDIAKMWVDNIESTRISYLHKLLLHTYLLFLTYFIYLVDLLASNGKHVMLVGPASSGKSSILQSFLLKQKKYQQTDYFYSNYC